MADHDYEAGLRDGKIQALEDITASQSDRLDKHDGRISNLERATYAVLGIVVFVQTYPALVNFFGAG